MNYVEHLNNFAAASLEAGLGANEIALYMRLFWKANNEFWPEYIEMSLSDLQKMTGIKSHHTVIKARNILKSLGFIDFCDSKGKKTRYHIVGFELWQNLPSQKYLGNKCLSTSAINAQAPRQNLPKTSAINAQVTPPQPRDTSASEATQNYKHNKLNKTIYNNRDNSSNCNSDLAQVFSLYQECITTAISPIQVDKLKDDVKTYGKNKVMYAILRAAEMGKNNLAYIEGILKNDNQKGENRSDAKRRNENTERDTERDEANRKWREQLREAVEKQQFPWDQPGYNANEC